MKSLLMPLLKLNQLVFCVLYTYYESLWYFIGPVLENRRKKALLENQLELQLIKKDINVKQFINELSEGKLCNNTQVYWFHCSSAGEFESLRLLIDNLLFVENRNVKIVITFFSKSALSSIQKYYHSIPKQQLDRILYCYFLPTENNVKKFVLKVNPACFISVKYDAWPILWLELTKLECPIIILGARPRSSIWFGYRVCESLGYYPRLFFCIEDQDVERTINLKKLANDSTVRVLGDSRWESVFKRKENESSFANQRVKKIILNQLKYKTRIMVFGNIWASDVELVISEAAIKEFKGDVFLIPHSLEENNVDKLKEALKINRIEYIEIFNNEEIGAQANHKSEFNVFLLLEYGLLAEFYQSASLVYIGGGFEKGIHSTIEPAVYGVPISCGPKNAELFFEVSYLIGVQQLKVVENSEDFQIWLKDQIRMMEDKEACLKLKAVLVRKHEEKFKGSTERILKFIQSVVDEKVERDENV